MIRFAAVLLPCVTAIMSPAQAQDAAALKARYTNLREPLSANPFGRPLTLASSQSSSNLQGDAYAVIEQPYAIAGAALQDAAHWCDILILHQNVKSCRASRAHAGDQLTLGIGRKFEQPLADAYPFEFFFKVVSSTPRYLQVLLGADQGPLGTSDYRIALEVVALDARSSFLHLSYAYDYGLLARMAIQGYLATTGRNKVGFSIVGHETDGRPIYIAGVRGVVERNTMRYYLAIEAYLGALSAPPAAQLEKRLAEWYAGAERYPRQLHELQRSEYLEMKRREVQRQRMPDAVTR